MGGLGGFKASDPRASARTEVQSPATSAAGAVDGGASLEDLLRSALGVSKCIKLADEVLREEGTSPTVELPRVRTHAPQHLDAALEDRLIVFGARLSAHR
jgi:hypothetical protein